MFGTEICEAFREFKTVWDPYGKMNPGKIVDPYPITENLRLGTDFAPREPTTHFQFTHDEGSFTHAALRCVGIGECRRQEKGTMCPSYRATMEEKHSTRGRAHLMGLDAEKKLFAAMGAKAEILDDGCCDMAGSFGFEEQKYAVSMTVYDHQLGPRLRELPFERLVLADGFICKTQIEHATGRRPLHLAQLLQMARRGFEPGKESRSAGFNRSPWKRNGALLLGSAGLALGAWYLGRRILR